LFMKTLIRILTVGIVFLGLFFQTSLFAGAWAQPKGHYYTKLTFIYSKADGLYGTNFPAKFTDYSLYFYGEYGVLDKTTVILNFPSMKRSIDEASSVRGKTTGFLAGDFEIQAKYQFLSKPLVASALIGTKVPTVYKVEDFPPLGNGETDFDAKLLLGASLYPIPAYLTGDVGYRIRGGDFIDEINFNFEAGYTFFKKYLVRLAATGIRGTKDSQGDSNLLGFPLSQKQYRIGGGIIYKLSSNFEFDVTYLNTISGNNIPKSNEVFIGIAFKN
jgi:hypothetical protein